MEIFVLFKRFLFSLLWLFALASNSYAVEVTECKKLGELFNYLEEDTLVVFNVNNVLLHMSQSLGSTPWAVESVQRIQEERGIDKPHATNLFIPYWHQVLIASDVYPVEAETEAVIRKLQKLQVPLMGLTNRYIEMAYPTLYALRSLGIDLSLSTISDEDRFVPTKSPAKFIEGVVFNGLINNKGDTLIAFLKDLGYKPKKVIYVEDKEKHLKYLGERVEEYGCKFLGVRYGAMDAKRIAYDPAIAKVQADCFDRLLTDEEAGALISYQAPHEVEQGGPKAFTHIENLEQLQEVVEPDDLIVSEIDNLWFCADAALATPQKLQDQIKKWQSLGLSDDQANKKAMRPYEKFQRKATVHSSLKNPNKLIEKLLTQADLLFITFRPKALKWRTKDQLKEVGVTKKVKTFYAGSFEGKATAFRNLHLGNYKRVVAIEDSEEKLTPYAKISKERGIPFVGVVFRSQEVKKRERIPNSITKTQKKYFNRILSDYEASVLKDRKANLL